MTDKELEEPTMSLEELGKIKTVKVYTQSYVDKQQKRIEALEKENKDLEWQLKEVVRDNDYYQAENAELKAQIEKMKCCENCAWWYKLSNGQRDCAETCENQDNWSLRR